MAEPELAAVLEALPVGTAMATVESRLASSGYQCSPVLHRISSGEVMAAGEDVAGSMEILRDPVIVCELRKWYPHTTGESFVTLYVGIDPTGASDGETGRVTGLLVSAMTLGL